MNFKDTENLIDFYDKFFELIHTLMDEGYFIGDKINKVSHENHEYFFLIGQQRGYNRALLLMINHFIPFLTSKRFKNYSNNKFSIEIESLIHLQKNIKELLEKI